jgi:hypothetical protein
LERRDPEEKSEKFQVDKRKQTRLLTTSKKQERRTRLRGIPGKDTIFREEVGSDFDPVQKAENPR